MEELQIALPENLEDIKLPSPEMVNYWRLAENRIFYIDDEIDINILEIQRAIIAINIADKGIEPCDRKSIKLYIDSPGGLLSEAMSLATTCILSTTPVITVNIAEAYSGGALLLLAGHKRYGFPYSKAMIHTGSRVGGGGTFEQTEEAQKLYKKQIEEMGQYILERSGMDEKVFKKNKSKDWYFDVNEQLSYGLITDIVTDFEQII
jgi:ATP-dependent Clp protease protease subunit